MDATRPRALFLTSSEPFEATYTGLEEERLNALKLGQSVTVLCGSLMTTGFVADLSGDGTKRTKLTVQVDDIAWIDRVDPR